MDAIKKRNELGLFSGNDLRGNHDPSNKTSPEIIQQIQDHIASFPTMESHYTRNDTKRQYLDVNLRKMHELYKEMCRNKGAEPASDITYRRIFSNHYNLSFFVPKKDLCVICTNYEKAAQEKKQELENSYKSHIKRKQDCNEEKERDKERALKDPHFTSITFDLQAVLQIPTSNVSLLYYSRKMIVYNLALYEFALPNNGYCFTWSEINGKKGSCEIGTILMYYLRNCISSIITEITLFSDTCGGQNRNQFISALLLWLVQQKDVNLQVIEQKFLESGHTYLECDSMHSSIETVKKHSSVYSMMDWISIFKQARRKKIHTINNKKITREPYKVKEFKFHEFYDLKELSKVIIKNRKKDEMGNTVNWLKIKRLKYIKGDHRIYFNYDMSNNFNYIDVSRAQEPKVNTNKIITRNRCETVNINNVNNYPVNLKKMYDHPQPISAAKKKDLLNLCRKGIIPEELHGWYENLPTSNNLTDKVPDIAVDESDNDS